MKNKSIRSLAIAVLGVGMALPAQAQQSGKPRPELAITVGGLASSLEYDVSSSNSKQGTGGSAGFEYTYYVSKNFGVSLGAEYSLFEAKAEVPNLSGAYNAVDFEQEPMEFRYRIANLREKQAIGFVNVPLMLTYVNVEHGFYVKAGAKLGLPVHSHFSGGFDLSTSGYYAQYNAELTDPAFMGFGQFDGQKSSGNAIDTKINYIASIEVGTKLPFGNNSFYAGFYLDYGLTDISKKTGAPVDYNVSANGVAFGYRSVLNSGVVDEVRTLSYGLRLRYAFSI